MQKPAEKIKILAPEDEVASKFHYQACNFIEFFNSLHDFRSKVVEAVKLLMLPLPAPVNVLCFRVSFHFLTFGIFCLRF